MRTPRFRTVVLTVLTLLTPLLTAGCVAVGSGTAPGTDPSQSQSRQDLDALTVAAPRSMAGYSRDHFPHWIHQQGSECDTREYVLKRDGTDVRTSQSCHVTGGHWVSPYDNKTVTDANSLDI